MAKSLNPSAQNKTDVAKSVSDSNQISDFVAKARALAQGNSGEGRIILALDATMSRQPTWDMACEIQSHMFEAAGNSGRLQIQLVYYRGFGECAASRFVTDTGSLKKLMRKIDCRGGHTQIHKVLSHALKENQRSKVNALIFIGDAMEENVDDLAVKAGELGLQGVPVFVFQEGHDGAAEIAFKEIARLSRGAWFRFDSNAAATLAKLLSSIAVYATGGLKALASRNRPEDRLMLDHLVKKQP